MLIRSGISSTSSPFRLTECNFINVHTRNIEEELWGYCTTLVLDPALLLFCPLCLTFWEGLWGFEKCIVDQNQFKLWNKNHNTVNGWIFTLDNVIKKCLYCYATWVQATPRLLDSGSSVERTRTKWRSRARPSDNNMIVSPALIHVICQIILNKRIRDNAFANTIREQTSMCM